MNRHPPRRALAEISEQLGEVTLATVVAPAGSGKSTLITHWREALTASGVSAFEILLTPLHEDVGVLLRDLLDAIRAENPDFGRESRHALMATEGAPEDWRSLLRAFRRDAVALPSTVLFIDDYHVISAGSPSDRFLSELLRSVSRERLRFVVASRGTLPSAAPRLRAAGAMVEVGPDDLNLRSDEVRSLLADEGVDASEEALARLVAETEGWVTGVLLARRALSALPAAEHLAYLENLARHDDLFEYIASEALIDEQPETVETLEWSALLGHSTPAELQAIFPGAEAARVERAVQQGLLLRVGGEVGPHPLWQSLLRSRRRERVGEDAWRADLVLAGRSHEQAGRLERALQAFADAEEWQLLIDTLIRESLEGFGQAVLLRSLHWLEQLPPGIGDDQPGLLYLHGVVRMRGEPDRADALLARAQELFTSADDPRGAHVVFTRVILLGAQGRQDELRQLVRGVLSVRGLVRNRETRDIVLLGMAGWGFLRQRYDRANSMLERVGRRELPPVPRWIRTIMTTLVLSMRGEPDRALLSIEHGLDDDEQQMTPLMAHVLILGRGIVRAFLGQNPGAIADLENGLRSLDEVRWSRIHEMGTRYLTMSLFASGRRDEAIEMLRRLAGRLAESGDADGEGSTLAQLALLLHVVGDDAGALEAANRGQTLLEPPDRGRHLVSVAVLLDCWWVLARVGRAEEAWRQVQSNLPRFKIRGLPFFEHNMALEFSEIARLAGHRREAERHAADAWRIAANVDLRIPRPLIAHLINPVPAATALRLDVESEFVFDRMQELCPDALADCLVEMARERSVPTRERAMNFMGRLGGRRFHEVLVASAKDRSPTVRAAAESALERVELRPDFRLGIRSLGTLEVSRGEELVAESEWRGAMPRRLLAHLLAAEGRELSRDKLLADLWPDASEEAARNSLRVALHRLNEVLDPDRPASMPSFFVSAASEGLKLNLAGIDSWDALAFRRRASAGRRAAAAGQLDAAIEELSRAIAEYGGEFLPEHAFEPSTAGLRGELGELFRSVGVELGEMLVAAERFDEAIGVARRMQREDPSHEAATALEMRVHLARGDASEAIRSFSRCCDALAQELEVAPGRSLQELVAMARS